MNMLKFNPNGTVTLCGRPKSCCPVVTEIDENTIKITDDDGKCITITKEQAKLIDNALELFENKEELLNE